MFIWLTQILQGYFWFGYLTGSSFPKPLTPEEERKYLEAHAKGDEDAKNILVERNLRLVAHVAKKFTNHGKDHEDLISVGSIGLMKGILSFKPEKSTKLATYAAKCIENEILMYLRAQKKHSKNIYLQDVIGTDHEGNEVHVEDKLADEDPPIDEKVTLKMQINVLYNIIKKVLHGREKTVIILRYGLGNHDEQTQREIAETLNISRSYVSRIEKKALLKLAKIIDSAPDIINQSMFDDAIIDDGETD